MWDISSPQHEHWWSVKTSSCPPGKSEGGGVWYSCGGISVVVNISYIELLVGFR